MTIQIALFKHLLNAYDFYLKKRRKGEKEKERNVEETWMIILSIN